MLDSIQKLQPPKDVTRVKSFLGVINYFRKFIIKCSILAEPLLLLTKVKRIPGVSFFWGEDQKTNFEALKACMITFPISRFPNFTKKFFMKQMPLQLDWGLCWVNPREMMGLAIDFKSLCKQVFSKYKRNYGITKLEGLTVSWAISYFWNVRSRKEFHNH